MSAPSKIQQFLDTAIRPRLKELQDGHDEQLPGLNELVNQLAAATQDSDVQKIKKLMDALGPQLEYVGKEVSAIRNLKQTLDKVSLNGAAESDVKLVTKLKEDVKVLEGKLQRNFSKLKSLEDEANDVLDKVEQSSGKIAGDWAVLEVLVKDHLANAKTRLQQSTGEFDKFEKARAERNRATLEKARENLGKLLTGSPTEAEVQAAYSKFAEKAKGTGLDPHAKDQLARELPGLKKSVDEASGIEAKIAKFNTDARGRGFPPVDLAKAMKVLKITAKSAMPKLQAAFAQGSPGMEKALDALAKDKDVNSKLTGQQMADELRKANVI